MNPVAKARILRRICDQPTRETTNLLKRIEIELEFAETFTDALGDFGGKERATKAKDRLEAFDPEQGSAALGKLVQDLEADLADVGKLAKTYTIHCVAHGHIDMNWMWSWPETVSMTHDTFASMLNFMDQYPDLTYSQSQASVYAAVQKHHPKMFEEIKRRVKEGRWEVAASHWVEGDKNLSSGEALCRHLLYTRDYFEREFGLKPEDVPIDWEPDTFGHANTIPSIDKQGGVKFYYSCRTGGGVDHPLTGVPRPPLFWWRGPDGAQALVNRETTWYNSYVNIGDNIAAPLVEFLKSTKLHHWLNVYGIGNHGGGPTRKEIDYLIETSSWPIYPTVVFSTAKRFFEAATAEIDQLKLELPVLDHELNYEFTGCYTSQSLIKQANRFGENYCLEAETLSLIDGTANGEKLREAWTNVLFNQFHDILPGSGVRETREHARALFQEVGAITGGIKREALKNLAAKIDTASMLPHTCDGEAERSMGERANAPFVAGSGSGSRLSGLSQAVGGGKAFKPIVIYNPCPWTRSEPVLVALYDTGFKEENIVALDEKGRSHPTTGFGKGEDWADWGHEKITVLFYAQDIPPLGYRTYLLCEGVPDVKAPLVQGFGYERFETPFIKCAFDRQSGGLTQLELKGTGTGAGSKGIDFANGPQFGQWLKELEHDQIMSAWVVGQRVCKEPLMASSFSPVGPKFNIGTNLPEGPGALACRVESTLAVPDSNKSSVKLRALVHPLCPRIDFEAEIDWREIGDRQVGIPGLAVAFFNPGAEVKEAVYETPFGTVTRQPLAEWDLPSLRFVHARLKSGAAFTLLQDCKYGFETSQHGVKMRVLRSSFNPDHAPEVAKTSLRYAIHLHESSPSDAELVRLGSAWNHPFIVAPASIQGGDAPALQGFAEVKTPGVVMSSLKQALRGDGIVLRLVSYEDIECDAEVELNPAILGTSRKAGPIDLMERPADGTVWLEGGTLKARIPARGFVSVLLS